jgi:hypothetical protein
VTLLAFRSRPRETGHIALISFPIRVQHHAKLERHWRCRDYCDLVIFSRG